MPIISEGQWRRGRDMVTKYHLGQTLAVHYVHGSSDMKSVGKHMSQSIVIRLSICLG